MLVQEVVYVKNEKAELPQYIYNINRGRTQKVDKPGGNFGCEGKAESKNSETLLPYDSLAQKDLRRSKIYIHRHIIGGL